MKLIGSALSLLVTASLMFIYAEPSSAACPERMVCEAYPKQSDRDQCLREIDLSLCEVEENRPHQNSLKAQKPQRARGASAVENNQSHAASNTDTPASADAGFSLAGWIIMIVVFAGMFNLIVVRNLLFNGSWADFGNLLALVLFFIFLFGVLV